jgi:hypothetical protein
VKPELCVSSREGENESFKKERAGLQSPDRRFCKIEEQLSEELFAGRAQYLEREVQANHIRDPVNRTLVRNQLFGSEKPIC